MGRLTLLGLRCTGCGRRRGADAVAVCEECWAALEPEYDLAAVRTNMTRDALAARPPDPWRYAELLPVAAPAGASRGTGFTPLVKAERLGARLGIAELWVKYDALCCPTLSFKDRLVAVALAKAKELGMDTVGCASTGNLALALAAAARAAGLQAVILVPEGVEAAKLAAAAAFRPVLVGVRGNYDRANRLSAQIADRRGWGFVNVNLRAYYGEGSKTVGYELAEQLGWRVPGHVVVPMAGGSLLTKLARAFDELRAVGLVAAEPAALHGAQPRGCNPIVAAWRGGQAPKPVKPDTIVHSLAVGDPADGLAAAETIRSTGGRAEDPSDAESLEGVRLLAECEGLFAETAGGTVVAAARRLGAAGAFADGRPVVLVVTGHGLKTAEALGESRPLEATLDGSLDAFDAFWAARAAAA